MVSKLKREDLLVYKEKDNRFANSQLLVIPYDINSRENFNSK